MKVTYRFLQALCLQIQLHTKFLNMTENSVKLLFQGNLKIALLLHCMQHAQGPRNLFDLNVIAK